MASARISAWSAASDVLTLWCGLGVLAASAPAAAQQDEAPPPTTELAPVEPSADIALEPGVDGADASAAPAPTRFELQIELEELIEAGDYAAAAALAEQFLELTAQEFGPDSERLAATQVQVASVQSRNEQYAAAEENALRAIEIYRNVGGSFAPELIEPYVVLGDSYQSSGDYPSALSAYNEARTVSRRAYGLLNEGQIAIIDRISDTAIEMSQFSDAQSLQLEALRLIERSYEAHSHELLDAIFKYALWLRENNLFALERAQYMRADRIIRDHYGDASLELVRALRERANSYRVQGSEDGIGISGLRDALEILERHAEPLLKAEVLRDIGDWEVAFSRVGTDGSAYLSAWQLLSGAENGEALREQWFQETAMVFTAPLSRRGLSTNPDHPWGNVVLHFTVDTAGRTRDVEVVESHPPGLKDEAFARQFRQSRFRPMIRDGEFVPVRRAFDIKFQYEPEDEDE